MSEKIELIVEDLKKLTLLEASELVKKIEEVFQVDANISGSLMMNSSMSIPLEGVSNELEEEPKTEFDVILNKVPSDKKIAVLKIVRSLTGLGLKEAKQLVDTPPQTLKESLPKIEAEKIKQEFEEVGAEIELK